VSPARPHALLALGLLAVLGLIAWTLLADAPARTPPDRLDLDPQYHDPLDLELRGDAPAPASRNEAGSVKAAANGTAAGGAAADTPRPPPRDPVPRVLPPDAAIEDLRDALTAPATSRTQAVQAAYEAITRIADDGAGVSKGLRSYVERVERPLTRGIVLAGLGSDRGTTNLGWLTRRLRNAGTDTERLGALLGLAFGKSEFATTSQILAGIKHPIGDLPTDRPTLTALAGFVDRTRGDAAADAAAILVWNVARHVEHAALLVVEGKRTCALFDALSPADRTLLRKAALKHDALPGAVRRVLEAAR